VSPYGPARRGLTLAAIGRRAGVSAATVSKVLNGRPDVAAATRRRVQAVLDAYSYPGGNRRNDHLIDVVLIELDDPWAARVLAEVERAARRSGLGIIPSACDTQSISDELLTRVLARNCRGLITIFADLSEMQQRRLRAHGLAHVVVAGGRPGGSTIDVDFRTSVREATEHLLATGHHRIGLLLGPRALTFTEERRLGFVDALSRAGRSLDPALVRWGRFDQETAADHTRSLLELPDPPTAIVAGSDTMAIGVYAAVEAAGLRVGADVAVVGFDDRPESRWLVPSLTTIRMPLSQLAEAAVDHLLARGPSDRPARLPGKLIIRESTARSQPR
jgi:LacI family transcriptional regulator